MSELKVNTSLTVVEYMKMVNDLIAEYFDENGDYSPQYGRLNAMRLFYNKCVKDDVGQVPHTIEEATEMQALIESDAFIDAFNKAVETPGISHYDFGNAYSDALSIVDVRKTSLSQAVNAVKRFLIGLVDSITPMLSEENLTRIEKIAGEIKDGKLSAESIVTAVGNSDFMNNSKAATV